MSCDASLLENTVQDESLILRSSMTVEYAEADEKVCINDPFLLGAAILLPLEERMLEQCYKLAVIIMYLTPSRSLECGPQIR